MIYWTIRFIAGVLLKTLFLFRVEGLDNVPAKGPVLVCANHFSWLDPPLVAVALARPVRFMAKEELFGKPVLGPILKKVGAFPVRRGKADLGSIRRSLQLLEQGELVGMFPEGTRSRTGSPQEAYAGAVVLALRSGAPVVPAAIIGRYRLFGSPRIRFGQPVDLSGYGQARRLRQEELKAISNNVIMQGIRDLMA